MRGFGAAVEDYVKLIYKRSCERERVLPSAIAQEKGVSAAAVTKMVQRLAALNLATASRTDGIRLTRAGEKVALEIIRHHRLLELYLQEALGYSWDLVDAEAEKLEHVISEEFEDRIDAMLGRPTRDPHGAPIPTKEGRMDDTRHPMLAELRVGQRGTVECVSDRDPATLRSLEDAGLVPDADVEMLSNDERQLRVRVGRESRQVARDLACAVFVAVMPHRAHR